MNTLEAINLTLDEFDGEFAYGIRDCCLFAAKVVEQLTGENYMESFEYASEEEALALVEEAGGLKELASSVLGDPWQAHGSLKDGRPCLCRLPGSEPVMGVVLGQEAVVLTQYRTTRVPMAHIICVWRV